MFVRTARDDRGDYLVYACRDGQTFFIDPQDREVVGEHPWFILTGHSARCLYVARRAPRSRVVLLHREITDAAKGLVVDHEDGNGRNDRRYNLRVVTRAENRFNSHHPKRTSSGLRGVYDVGGGRWVAVISLSGKKKYLGTFTDPIDAAKAFDAAAIAHRGTLTQLNFPTCS